MKKRWLTALAAAAVAAISVVAPALAPLGAALGQVLVEALGVEPPPERVVEVAPGKSG